MSTNDHADTRDLTSSGNENNDTSESPTLNGEHDAAGPTKSAQTDADENNQTDTLAKVYAC